MTRSLKKESKSGMLIVEAQITEKPTKRKPNPPKIRADLINKRRHCFLYINVV
jgi:hypothetical protein